MRKALSAVAAGSVDRRLPKRSGAGTAELTRQARAHPVPTDARALPARWARRDRRAGAFIGFAGPRFCGAIVRSAQWRKP